MQTRAVTRHIGCTHAPVRIAADVDRCRPRERAMPATPEQADVGGRPVVDQKVRVAIGVDVVRSNRVRVRSIRSPNLTSNSGSWPNDPTKVRFGPQIFRSAARLHQAFVAIRR